MTLEQLYSDYTMAELNIAFVIVIALGLFFAFFGFKFIKIGIVLSAAVSGYELGTTTLGAAIGDKIQGFNASLVLGIACAIIFALLSLAFYKFCLHLVGILLGAVIGFAIPSLIFTAAGQETIGLIAGLVLAIIAGGLMIKLIYKLFKGLIILSSAFSGGMLATVAATLFIFGDNETALGLAVLVGLVISIFAMLAQFRMNKGVDFEL